MTTSGGEKKSHALGRLKPVFGVVVLALVAYFVPWSDRVTWTKAGVSQSVVGSIRGEWKSDEIDFAPKDSDAPLAAELVPYQIERGWVHVKRASGFEWRPGLLRVFKDLDASGLAKAFGCLCIGIGFTVLRWWRLLAAAGCRMTLFATGRLTLLGMFFNIVVPGLTGGDLIKAVLVARENPGRKTEAVISVFVDRIIGILALAALAAVVIAISGDRFEAIRWPVIASLGAGVLGIVVYVNGPLRRLIRLDRLLAKLPASGALQKIDEAVLVYSKRPLDVALAVLFSIGNHLIGTFGVLSLGRAFGDTLPSLDYFAAVPVANIASALPISPGGWGVGEAVYGSLWVMLGGTAALGIAVSVTYRLLLLSFGMLGGLFLLFPGGKVDLVEVEREASA